MASSIKSDAVTAGLEPPLHPFSTVRRLVGEALGTALLLAVVVGSGIMGERLAMGNDAIALLGNTVSTGAARVVLVTILGPRSGGHFNPAVTLVLAGRPLHHLGLLVHGRDLVRHPGRDDRAKPIGHLCGHRAVLGSRFHRRADRRRCFQRHRLGVASSGRGVSQIAGRRTMDLRSIGERSD